MSASDDPDIQPADQAPKVRLVQGQEVSLGCGTLILIALIVLIFGRSSTRDVERQLEGLRTEVQQLRTSVESQTTQIQELRDRLVPRQE